MEEFDYNKYKNRTRTAESGGNDSAKNKLSSATGRYQFIKSTWEELGYDWKDRFDPSLQEEAMEKFTMQNVSRFQDRFGYTPSYEDVYGMHVLGFGGFSQILSADQDDDIQNVLSSEVLKANPTFGKQGSVSDFRRYLGSKVKTSSDIPVRYANNEPKKLPDTSINITPNYGYIASAPTPVEEKKPTKEQKSELAKLDILNSQVAQMFPQQQPEQQVSPSQPTYGYLTDTNLFTI